MQRHMATGTLLICALLLPVMAAAIQAGAPTPEERAIGKQAIENCRSAAQARGAGSDYCKELGRSLSALNESDEGMALRAMAATPATADWPWCNAATLAEHGASQAGQQRIRAAARRYGSPCAQDAGAASDPPAGSDSSTSSVRACDSQTCFAERAAACQPALLSTPQRFGARAEYRVLEAVGERGCRIEMRYRQNPNAALVDKPLTFVIDRSQAIEPQLKSGVASCLAGDGADFDCGGTLYPGAQDSDKAAPVAGSRPPCGRDVEASGEPLFALPRDGAWGYVNRDGSWVIQPRWRSATAFQEGRAMVKASRGWGVIDRRGRYVVEPQGRLDFQPYSQGCAAANSAYASEPRHFIDRHGHPWLKNDRPASLAEYEIDRFGSFSQGMAWFRIEEAAFEYKYGWIDQDGRVVIAPEFGGGGPFSAGLAPASAPGRDDLWGFVDPAGQLTLPRKWRFERAQFFSEGLALVEVDFFEYAYLKRDGTMLTHLNLPQPLAVPVRGDPGQARPLESAKIGHGGAFRNGLAPVEPKRFNRLLYIDPEGVVQLDPEADLQAKPCYDVNRLPEFRHGLVRLLVADAGDTCPEVDPDRRINHPAPEGARYVYLDAQGQIVLEQQRSGAP